MQISMLDNYSIFPGTLCDSLPDAVLIVDHAGIITHSNARCTEMFGFAKEELLLQPLSVLFSESLSPMQDFLLNKHFHSEIGWQETMALKFKGKMKSGKEFYLNFSRKLIENSSDWVVVIRDVSQYIQNSLELESAMIRLKEAFLISKIGTWEYIFEEDRLIVSQELMELLGLDPHQSTFRLKDIEEFYHPQDRKIINKAYSNSLRNKIPFNIVSRINAPNELVQYARIRGRSEFDVKGRPVKTVGTIQDYTENHLQKIDTQESIQKLKENHQALENSLFIGTHDLKEPANNIFGLGELIKIEGADWLNENPQVQSYINMIQSSSKKIQKMVEGLLSYGKVGQDVEVEVIDFAVILDEVLDSLRFQLIQNKVELEISSLPILLGNREEIFSLFQNLISNAIKYRKEDQHPVIQIQAFDQGTEWLFTVEDNGIGINPSYADRVFELFSRIPSSTAIEGTGIGMPQCKRIVESHQGDLWFESEYGEGTVFYFTLKKDLSSQENLVGLN